MSRLVSELEGADLDYWVAEITGCLRLIDGSKEFKLGGYSPSTNWAQGGPIIECEHIGIAYYGRDEWTAAYNGPSSPSAENTDYESYWGFQRSVNMVDGPSPLIAAMRAFVASKYGENVPDEVQL